MLLKIKIYFVWLLLFTFSSVSSVLAQIADRDMISFSPSAKQQVHLYWKDDQGKILGNLAALKLYVTAKKQQLVFAMNGGMYQEDQSPLGLFIQHGKTIKAINLAQGSGNFYLQPNGVFYITEGGKGKVCPSTAFKKVNKKITYATQSGPMLVIDGKIHQAFKAGSTNVNIRNGVGILPDGSILFAMSKNAVSLYDFAAYFKKKGCKNALYLDGFVSRTYFPAAKWLQLDGRFGVMIGVTE